MTFRAWRFFVHVILSHINVAKSLVYQHPQKFFERDSVLTVSGKYSEQYFVSVQPVGEFDVEITISAKAHSSLSEDLLKQFMNDLIDQQIRIDLQKEFGQLRNIIIEYAFSPVSK